MFFKKPTYQGMLSNVLYWWLLAGRSTAPVFCHPAPYWRPKRGCWRGPAWSCPLHPCTTTPPANPPPRFSCIPQPRLLPAGVVKAPSLLHLLQRLPKARAGTATVAFEGYTSRIIFITIFIQCLSRRCTDPLQWRKKRTRNLFSKDIQIS